MYEVSYWVRAQARMRPESVAVVGDGIRWTYRELDAEVDRVRRRLTRGLGLERGDRVAILSANGQLDAAIYFGSPHKDYPVWQAAPGCPPASGRWPSGSTSWMWPTRR